MNSRTLHQIGFLGVLGAVVACAEADTVATRSRLTYDDVRVTGLRDFALVGMAAGRETLWPLSEIARVKLSRRETFNRAEDLAAAGRWAEAVPAYERAAREAREPWLRQLCRIRRMQALEGAGRVGEAALEWLEILGEDASEGALALRPSAEGAAVSQENEQAIRKLQGRLARPASPSKVSRSLLGMLMELQRLQGRTSEAAETAARLVALSTPASDDGPRIAELLSAGETLLEGGRASEALEAAQAAMMRSGRDAAAGPLMLRARARIRLARQEQGAVRETLLCRAGLDLMRIFVERPEDPRAPAALLEAARLQTALSQPNLSAARAAYEEIMNRYPQTPAAAEARQALGKLSPGVAESRESPSEGGTGDPNASNRQER